MSTLHFAVDAWTFTCRHTYSFLGNSLGILSSLQQLRKVRELAKVDYQLAQGPEEPQRPPQVPGLHCGN